MFRRYPRRYDAGNATQIQRGGTATENKDFAPEHNEYHSKSSSNNMNHTFHTIEDDLFEGIEAYWAGFATGTLLVFTDGFYCPVQIWDDDVLRLRSSEFSSKPVDGKTYRAGETIEIAVKYNGKVTIGERNAPVYIPLEVGDADTGHARKAMYLRGAETDTLVFGYTVQEDDSDSDGISIDSGGRDGDGNTYVFTGTGTIKAAGTNVERNPSYSGRYDTGDPVDG